ncbi:MAG: hypothetical protein Q9177_001684 [Variospora cf. flavescens]
MSHSKVQSNVASTTTIARQLPSKGTIRHDLTPHQLFYLSFLRVYVSNSYRTIATHFNRNFEAHPAALTPKDCSATYLGLHDSEHESWIRARNMNREEPELLKVMMQFLGVAKRRWDVELISPVGPMGCCRVAE